MYLWYCADEALNTNSLTHLFLNHFSYFRFGAGSSLGMGMLIDVPKQGDLNHDVTVIHLYTGNGFSGVWELEEGQCK